MKFVLFEHLKGQIPELCWPQLHVASHTLVKETKCTW